MTALRLQHVSRTITVTAAAPAWQPRLRTAFLAMLVWASLTLAVGGCARQRAPENITSVPSATSAVLAQDQADQNSTPAPITATRPTTIVVTEGDGRSVVVSRSDKTHPVNNDVDIIPAEESALNAQGRLTRIRLLRREGTKYPVVRREETIRNLPQGEQLITVKEMVADHVMVSAKTKQDLITLERDLPAGCLLRRVIPGSTVALVSIPATNHNDFHTYKDRISAQAGVSIAEPDYLVKIVASPNDPSFTGQWALDNQGQTGGTTDADIDAPEAWDIATGSRTVKVGIIDTGMDLTHPDLVENLWTNPGEIIGNGLDDDGNGYIDDVHGWNFVSSTNNPTDDHFHGTHVAGTIGASGNNGVGVSGVCWEVSLIPLKFLDENGSGYVSDAVEAVLYSNLIGCDLTSNSWGGGGFVQSLNDAIAAAGNQGRLFVAAAGNDSSDTDTSPTYPANYNLPNVISVAASDRFDARASFSNYGLTSVDLAAPGAAILSTFPTIVTGAMAGQGFSPSYGSISGTSMAAPHVSGACALLKAYDPVLNASALKDRILGTVDQQSAWSAIVASGGRLNLNNLLHDIRTPRVYATMNNPSANGLLLSSTVTVAGTANASTGFQNYVLEIGAGTTPASWSTDGVTLSSGGTQPVHDAHLGTCQIPSAGIWTIRLTVSTTTGLVQTISRWIQVDPLLKPGFPSMASSFQPFVTGPEFCVVVADIIGDQKLEIMASTDSTNSLYAIDAQGQTLSGWPVAGGFVAYPAAGNVDGGAKARVVTSFYHSPLWGSLDGNGQWLSGWPQDIANFSTYTPTLADLNGDGIPEILTGMQNRAVHAFYGNGTPVPGWPQSVMHGQDVHFIVAVDLDHDGSPEVLALDVGTSAGKFMYCWRANGAPVPGWPKQISGQIGGQIGGMVAGDVMGDGDQYIVITWNGQVVMLDASGTPVPGWPYLFPGTPRLSPPVLADLDGNGRPEILFTADGSPAVLHALRSDGTELSGWPVAAPANHSAGQGYTPLVGDIDGDGQIDVLIGYPSAGTTTALCAYHRNGAALSGWPKSYQLTHGLGMAIADIDQDGRNDVIAASGGGGEGLQPHIYAWDFNAPQVVTSGAIEWGQFGGGSGHRCVWPTSPSIPSSGKLAFSALAYVQTEGNSGTALATISVMRSGSTYGAISVAYATGGGSAAAGSDYTTTSGILSWANGDSTTKTFTIAITGDTVSEGDETILLTLSAPTGGATLGLAATALTIIDDESATLATVTLQQGFNGYTGTIDTCISNSSPTNTAGGATQSLTQTQNPIGIDSRVVAVRFAIFASEGGPVPNGATITSATLSLYQYSAVAHGFGAHRLLKGWNESGCSWLNATAAMPWTAAGASGVGSDYFGTADGTGATSATAGWLSLDVTTGVQAFASGTINYGWRLKGIGSSGGLENFRSREHTPDTTVRPKLTVTYTTGAASNHAPIITQPASAAPNTVHAGLITTLSAAAMDFDNDTMTYSWNFGDSTTGSGSSISHTYATAGSYTATVTINDGHGGTVSSSVIVTVSAPIGTLAFYSPTYTHSEGNNQTTYANISVTRTGGSYGTASLSYATSGGTATAGNDYEAVAGTLIWLSGDIAAKTFSVPVWGDTSLESNETVLLTLTSPTGGAGLGLSSAALTIANDDTPPVGKLAFSSASYNQAEGNSGAANVTITVTRTAGSYGAISVAYAISNGSATVGSDYTAMSGTLNWADGDTAAKTFTMSVIGDTNLESDETVLLTLGSPTGGASLIAPSLATLTITNDEAAEFTTVTLQQGLDGYVGATDTYMSSSSPTNTTGGSSQSLNQTGNSRIILVRFPIFATEGGPVPNGSIITSAVLSLYQYGPSDGPILRAHRLLRTWTESSCSWNEAAAGVAWTVPGASGVDSDYLSSHDASVTAQLAGWLNFNVTMGVQAFAAGTTNHGWRLRTAIGSGTENFRSREYSVDSTMRPKLVVTYSSAPANQPPVITQAASAAPNPVLAGSSTTLAVSASDSDNDALSYAWTFGDSSSGSGSTANHVYAAAGSYTATVTVSDGRGGTASSSIAVTVNAPPSGTLAFSSAAYSQAEGSSGTALATITVTRSDGSYGAVGVSYATSDGNATAGSDYTATSGTLNWANGDSAAKTFTFAIAGDTTVESDETVLLALSAASGGATLGLANAAVSITNDDAASAITVTLQQGLSGYTGTTDTYMSDGSPTNTAGGATQNLTQTQNPIGVDSRVIAVRFAIFASEGGPVPNGATITSAALSLYQYSTVARGFGAHRLLKAWSEGSCSWLNAATALPWTVAGANGVGSDHIGIADGTGATTAAAGWLTVDVTAGIQAFGAGASNYGWRLKGIGSTGGSENFRSRESVPDTSVRPKLIIMYTTTGPSATDLMSPTGSG